MRYQYLILVLFFAACSGGSWLHRPIEAGSADWLQEGGNAGRNPPPARAGKLASSPKWTFSQYSAASRTQPLLMGRTLLLSGVRGGVDIVDLDTGKRTGFINNEWFVLGTPAIIGDKLYVATFGGEASMLCHSLHDASLLWSRRIDVVESAVLAHDNALFVVSVRGNVYRFNANDSTVIWSRQLDGDYSVGPVAADTIVVFAGENGDLTALSSNDGTVLWRVPTSNAFLASPMIEDGMLVAVNSHGAVLAVQIHTGEVHWRAELHEPVYVAPVISDDDVVLALSGGDVLLLHMNTGEEKLRIHSGRLPGAPPRIVSTGILLMARDGTLQHADPGNGVVTQLLRLRRRSSSLPLFTPNGVLLVDEEGEAQLFELQHEQAGGGSEAE